MPRLLGDGDLRTAFWDSMHGEASGIPALCLDSVTPTAKRGIEPGLANIRGGKPQSTSKVKAGALWGKDKDELTKQLSELKTELNQLRIQKIASSGTKLNKMYDVPAPLCVGHPRRHRSRYFRHPSRSSPRQEMQTSASGGDDEGLAGSRGGWEPCHGQSLITS